MPKKKCPLCGEKLIKKKGKYGKFWGCSQFPKCKGSESIYPTQETDEITIDSMLNEVFSEEIIGDDDIWE